MALPELPERRAVFVLGAGFTKGFIPDIPLLVDQHEVDDLIEEFKGLSECDAVRILESERGSDGKLDLERLMTRLHGGMPYDRETGRAVHRVLLQRVTARFVKSLNAAVEGNREVPGLREFARHCFFTGSHCVTFNYDDALDFALWYVRQFAYVHVAAMVEQYWHPNGGYGFFCRPGVSTVRDTLAMMDPTRLLLLKLHGSVNWFPSRGAPSPYRAQDVYHYEAWLPGRDKADEILLQRGVVPAHLEPEPYIVPPILTKDLARQPLLQVIWARAFEVLKEAPEVTFIGYSLPTTDIAATFLFREALAGLARDKVRVVNCAKSDDDHQRVVAAYRRVLGPGLCEDQFCFDGVEQWVCKELPPE
jgi:hypothetical protein